ncbi:hypothetical protein ACHAQH_009575 [Verticillium albo-atrum]
MAMLPKLPVKDIIICPNALDYDQLQDMPLNLQTILPQLPYQEPTWTVAHISRDVTSGKLSSALPSPTKARVESAWHPALIDFLQLRRVELLSPLVQECTWSTQTPPSTQPPHTTVIAKMARFDWEIPYIERETRAYQLLEGTGLAPRFLGHVHEEGRIIGFLLEKIEGRFAGIEDLASCSAALRQLHRLGIIHGDCNRYNFIVGLDKRVTLIDFEKSKLDADEAAMEAELSGLESQLREDSSRGGGFVLVEDEDEI